MLDKVMMLQTVNIIKIEEKKAMSAVYVPPKSY